MVALSSLPLADLEAGFDHLKSLVFDDAKTSKGTNLVMNYIEGYWMDGCYPPFVWNTWGRADDYTNNNQVLLIISLFAKKFVSKQLPLKIF